MRTNLLKEKERLYWEYSHTKVRDRIDHLVKYSRVCDQLKEIENGKEASA